MLPRFLSTIARRTLCTPPREYFYTVDVHGRLFIDDVHPKNLTSCVKDARALNFFFRRVQRAVPGGPLGTAPGFPYLSECAGEVNRIRCDDEDHGPIVFLELESAPPQRRTRRRARGVGFEPAIATDKVLMFGHSIPVPFDPSALVVSRETGRIFHPHGRGEDLFGGLGLVRSGLAVALADRMSFDPDRDCQTLTWPVANDENGTVRGEDEDPREQIFEIREVSTAGFAPPQSPE
jgi:hypothetical protein